MVKKHGRRFKSRRTSSSGNTSTLNVTPGSSRSMETTVQEETEQISNESTKLQSEVLDMGSTLTKNDTCNLIEKVKKLTEQLSVVSMKGYSETAKSLVSDAAPQQIEEPHAELTELIATVVNKNDTPQLTIDEFKQALNEEGEVLIISLVDENGQVTLAPQDEYNYNLIKLDDFLRALDSVQNENNQELNEQSIVATVVPAPEEETFIENKTSRSLTLSSDSSDVVNVIPSVTILKDVQLQKALVTTHRLDECPVYSKLSPKIKRFKYQACRTELQGYCDACNMSRYSWTELIQTNVYANSLLASRSKTRFNRLVFPDEELLTKIDLPHLIHDPLFQTPYYEDSNGDSSTSSCAVQVDSNSAKTSDANDLALEIPDEEDKPGLMDVCIALPLKELFLMVGCSLRGIYKKLSISKDFKYPFMMGTAFKSGAVPIDDDGCIVEESKVTNQENLKQNEANAHYSEAQESLVEDTLAASPSSRPGTPRDEKETNCHIGQQEADSREQW